MALYDGFFDASKESYEETGKYDRAYGPDDFTAYFAKVIGSGVCVHNNPDSMLVCLEGNTAIVKPGYLFIEGYWLSNVPGPGEDAETYKGYEIPLPGTGNYAIVAHLNLAAKRIELDACTIETAYTDSLVLAIVSPSAAEDTRHNTDLCGVIDTAGELSTKVEWAINYIDNEIENKLAAVEAEISAQSAKLDNKIAQVQAVADSITPPPVGTIKFSASQDVGEEWLRCDGSFINEADYPELVEALGKLTPSADKFEVISDGEIGPQISNGVIYEGRMWVYSYSTKKLYGVDLSGGGTKEIEVTSTSPYFGSLIAPTTAKPIALSVVPHKAGNGAKLFLAQFISDGGHNSSKAFADYFLVFCAEFSGNEQSLKVEPPFSSVKIDTHTIPGSSSGTTYYYYPNFSSVYVPYVVSTILSGVENYFCSIGSRTSTYGASYSGASAALNWTDRDSEASILLTNLVTTASNATNLFKNQRSAYSTKSSGEIVAVSASASAYTVYSSPSGVFGTSGKSYSGDIAGRESAVPLNVVGSSKVLSSFDKNSFPWASITESAADTTIPNLHLPSGARVFVDAGAYLWGKDIYMIFVGTGIIFSRTLEDGSFGYLDTTDILGQITQFGYLDYSQDEGTLYLLGQDTTNSVKVAKIVLNTLYNYANDGAWLPMLASDGVPAYIKAIGEAKPTVKTLKVTVKDPPAGYTGFVGYVVIDVNGELKTAGTYEYQYSGNSGTILVSLRAISATIRDVYLKAGTSVIAALPSGSPEGTTRSATLNVASYMESGLTLQAT